MMENSSNPSRKRNVQFDIARVFAVCWIVGFTHLANYGGESLKSLRVDFVADVTKTMLAIFMFISGYFLSKYSFHNKQDFINFYKKRLARFYMLFALAAVSLWMVGFNPDLFVLFTTLTGISSYVPPQPKTLWFISMIASFYFITPFLSILFHNYTCSIFKRIALCFVFFFMMYAAGELCGFDKRLCWCIMFYCLGLVFGRTDYINVLCRKKLLGLSFLAIYVILLYKRVCGYEYLNVELIAGVPTILFLAKWCCKLFPERVVLFISYASMAMYLFHRHIYIVEHGIYKKMVGTDCSVWFVYVIMFPSCIFLGYVIQKGYDLLVQRVLRK